MQHHYERKIAASMFEKRRYDCQLELKSLGDNGRFAGYASVFDIVDSQRDVIEKGAFADTLTDRVPHIKLLWQHSFAEPIGYFTAMFEDARGLYVEGQLLLDVARAKEALSLLKNGVVKGLSIGYSPTRYRMDPDTGVRHIMAVTLWEVSLVTFPANEAAQVSVVKSQPLATQSDDPYEMQLRRSGAMIALWDAMTQMEDRLARLNLR